MRVVQGPCWEGDTFIPDGYFAVVEDTYSGNGRKVSRLVRKEMYGSHKEAQKALDDEDDSYDFDDY